MIETRDDIIIESRGGSRDDIIIESRDDNLIIESRDEYYDRVKG